MAGNIAFDAKANNGGSTADGSAATWNHTCSGSDRILLVMVAGNALTAANATVSSVTYNGVAVTAISGFPYSSGNEEFVWMGYLVGPATGTNTVSVTVSSGGGWDGGWVGFSASFTGVHQSLPLDGVSAVTAAANSQTSISLNITPNSDNAFLVDIFSTFDSGTPTQNSPQVLGATVAAPTWSFRQGWSYNGPISPAGSTSDGWTGNSTRWRLGAISLRDVATVDPTKRFAPYLKG